MRRNIVYVLLGVVLIGGPEVALASVCAPTGVTVVYVNGILTSRDDVEVDAQRLQKTLGYQFGNESLMVRFGYNSSHIIGLGDAIETVSQIFNKPISNYDRDTILLQIHPEITTRKILLVGHSQGTFYTNEIYDYLIANGVPKESIGVYNIATPASSVSGNGEYLTSQNDKVINAVRIAASTIGVEQPLSANITIPPTLIDDMGHSFGSVYLAEAPVQIVTSIDSALKKLVSGEVSTTTEGGCFIPPAKNISYYAQNSAFLIADSVASGATAAVSAGLAFIETVGDKSSAAISQTLNSIVGTLSSGIEKINEKVKLASVIDSLGSVFSAGQNQGLKLAATVDLSEKNTGSVNSNLQANPKIAKAVKADAISGEFISLQDFINDTQNEDGLIEPVKNTDLIKINDKAVEKNTSVAEQKPVPACKFATDQSPLRQKLIINELAWMGGIGSANDEWIELKNISGGELDISGWQILDKEEQIKIAFGRNTKIGNGGYILLERTDDNSVPEIKADAIYAGALANTDEGLRLYDNGCNLSDEVFANKDWPAGDAGARKTMERLSDLSWHTYNGSGITLGNMLILGTPKSENSQLSVTGTSAPAVNAPAVTATTSASSGQASSEQVSLPEVPADPSKILISEIQITGGTGKSNNDFIEIYNPNSARVNLNGYRLVKRTKTGTADSSIKSWTSDAYIPARGYYLWANSDYGTISAVPDVTTSATISNDSGIAIRYGSEDAGVVIDSVSWGSAVNSFTESQSFAENPIANQSISRRTEIDGNNNSADFMKSKLTPKNSGTSGGFISPIDWSSQSAAPSDHILISEVYPDRTGANRDFLELYNPNASKDLSGWSLQILSANATSTDKISKKNFVSGNQIPESGFFLVGIDNYLDADSASSPQADMSWASGSLNSTDGATIFLVNATTTIQGFDDPKIVDRIAYGSSSASSLQGSTGLMSPENFAIALPAIGKSLERKSLRDGICVSAMSAGEFLGNGCDTDDNSVNFEERPVPNPQSSANLVEPRPAPSVIQNFTATYSTTTLQIILKWDLSQDSAGATSTINYALSYATSTAASFKDLVNLNATSSYSFLINEVGITYNFSIIAKDKDGLSAESSMAELAVPGIFNNAYLYPDPRNPGAHFLELNYGSYPFMNNPYHGGDSWRVLIAYKNQEASEIPQFYSDQQYAGEPEGSLIKQHGEWGSAINYAWKLSYPNCAGSITDSSALILPDTGNQCSANFGGVRNSSLPFGRLEDQNLIISLDDNQDAPAEGDYVTFGLYGYSGFNTQTLLAIDRQKYNFKNSAPTHKSPELSGELTLNFNRQKSQLEIGWQKATDSDTLDSILTYEVSYDAGISWESVGVSNKTDKAAVSGQSFSILVRAKDEFGNYSNPPLEAAWSYPETVFYVTQTQANNWSYEFGTKNPNCPGCFGTASLQSIQPQENFEFNMVTLKLKQETVSDIANLSLAVYPDLNGLPDFSRLIAEVQLTGMLNPDPNSDITFTFDNPVALTSQIKYWFVLSVKEYGDSRGYYRNQWKNAINTGGDLYDGGQASKGNSGVCDGYCAFTVPYPDATADWYMKIGRTQ